MWITNRLTAVRKLLHQSLRTDDVLASGTLRPDAGRAVGFLVFDEEPRCRDGRFAVRATA